MKCQILTVYLHSAKECVETSILILAHRHRILITFFSVSAIFVLESIFLFRKSIELLDNLSKNILFQECLLGKIQQLIECDFRVLRKIIFFKTKDCDSDRLTVKK